MAVDMFLKLDGIQGESKDQGHKDEIDIYSWSWGLTQTGSFGTGGGGGTGKVNVHDMTLTKKLDKASNGLTVNCASGKHIPNGVVTVRKAGDTPLEYLVITLNDILVSSMQTSGATSGDEVMETVSLNFSKFKVEYKEQQADGSGGPAVTYGWDVKQNVKV
ncbi:MAG TPA: type VI secretion system tube protein Hcp [Hyphomicrobiales bacterium]|nr:type VI secretion system tube protein Hcp [Hyphomicrobiales bacterium]